VEQGSPPPVRDEDLYADHDEDAPIRVRLIKDVLGPVPTPGLAQRVLA
jgi:hypothetical protein